MQLFILAKDVLDSAKLHADVHVIKIILELTQVLYAAWWARNPKCMRVQQDPPAYKPTHRNHPVAVWIRESESNYHYARDVALALCEEYKRRYAKDTDHKCKWHLMNPLATYPAFELDDDERVCKDDDDVECAREGCLIALGEDDVEVCSRCKKYSSQVRDGITATADVPNGVDTAVVCITNDDGLFNDCAEYDKRGNLKCVATYRNYYLHKTVAMKRKMTWRNAESDKETWDLPPRELETAWQELPKSKRQKLLAV